MQYNQGQACKKIDEAHSDLVKQASSESRELFVRMGALTVFTGSCVFLSRGRWRYSFRNAALWYAGASISLKVPHLLNPY
jgi:hypothetical protein